MPVRLSGKTSQDGVLLAARGSDAVRGQNAGSGVQDQTCCSKPDLCVCPSASGAKYTTYRTLQALGHVLAYSLPAKKTVSAGRGTEIKDREQANVFSHVGSLGP